MVNVLVDPALMVSGTGATALSAVRFADEVPTYTPVIFALLVPVFLMTTFMEAVCQDTFSLASITPACCIVVPVNVITQA